MTSRTEYCTQTPKKPSLFDVQYLRNHRTLDTGVLGYIGIDWPKEHSPEVRVFPPGTPCILRLHFCLYFCLLEDSSCHNMPCTVISRLATVGRPSCRALDWHLNYTTSAEPPHEYNMEIIWCYLIIL